MERFTFWNPVRIDFGKGAASHLPGLLAPFGRKVLLVYGGGSIKKNGIYSEVTEQLKKAGCSVWELPGIMANPRTTKVLEGIDICRREGIDFLLAVGGGSVIDCVKAIASAVPLEDPRDFWDRLYIKKEKITSALPFGTVLTMAATGSEMDCGGVITNWEEDRKESYGNPLLYPKFSVCDPVYTYTVPKNQVIFGSVDMLSHTMEAYFSKPDTPNVSDDIAETLMRGIISNLEAALQDLHDYTARSNLMWLSTLAINGLIACGKKEDWQTHQIEHALSAFYDIPHGAGLAIVQPHYYRYIYHEAPEKFARWARSVWHIDGKGMTENELALAGIDALQSWLKKIGAPTTLKEVDIPAEMADRIAPTVNLLGIGYGKVSTEDIRKIILSCNEE